MVEFLEKLWSTMKRSEVEMLISQSGSTQESHHEKIRSGQSYLYKKHGMESEVIEIRFKEDISGSFLNQALLSAEKRYPYLNTRMVELDGDFYIIQNNASMTARHSQKLSHLGSVERQFHLVDITYFKKSIYVSFHHALCDGRGIVPFVETLIYYYCKWKYKSSNVPDGVRLAEDKLLEGETVEPFLEEYEYDKDKEKDFISLSREAYAIPENVVTEETINYRFEVKIPHTDFMRVCKEKNATPVILVALLMSRGVAALYPDYDKPINANIATDMREALDVPNTFKNCVKSMILPYSRKFSDRPMIEQAGEWRELLRRQRDRDFCRHEANNMLGLFNKLDTLKTFEEKQQIMGFFDGMTLNTYIISYIGQYKLGNNAKYIEDIHLYNSGTTGLGINVTSCGENFVLDFKQNFQSDKYVKAFCTELDRMGLAHTASGAIAFETPEDSLKKR